MKLASFFVARLYSLSLLFVGLDRAQNIKVLKCKWTATEPAETLRMAHRDPCKRTQHCWPTTHATLSGTTCCVHLHGTTTMLALVAYSLKQVKLLGPCKRTQHCWPKTSNNTQCCDLLRPFAWALKQNNVHCCGLFTDIKQIAKQLCSLSLKFVKPPNQLVLSTMVLPQNWLWRIQGWIWLRKLDFSHDFPWVFFVI